MNGVFAVLAAAAALATPLPTLPAEGLAISDARGVTFVDLGGRRLGSLPEMRFANDMLTGLPRLVDRRGRRWAVDRARNRLVAADRGELLYGGMTLSFLPRQQAWLVRASRGRVLMRVRTPSSSLFVSERRDVVTSSGRALDLRTQTMFRVPVGCYVAAGSRPRWILLCRDPHYRSQSPRTIEELVSGRRRVIADPPGKQPAPNTQPVGHWAGVRLSPDGASLLAQWSAECETPVVYVVSRRVRGVRRLGAATDVSLALGWTSAGAAVVWFPQLGCGATRRSGPGVYAFTGKRARFVLRTSPRQSVAFWP
jgi:hypothetical protein